MSPRAPDDREGPDSADSSRPMALDSKAESASAELPAFLARPDGAPVYHGFPILEGVKVDGWRLGLVTDSIDTDDTWGDAYVVAPDGRRAGVVWQVRVPPSFAELSGPEEGRFGVFEVAVVSGPTSLSQATEFLAAVLPPIRDAWNRAKA